MSCAAGQPYVHQWSSFDGVHLCYKDEWTTAADLLHIVCKYLHLFI